VACARRTRTKPGHESVPPNEERNRGGSVHSSPPSIGGTP
jgi:hypothetical protein